MEFGFTRQASDYILDLSERELSAIWEDIQTTPLDTTAELWKKKLNKIADSYIFSSRFALMRILFSRVHGWTISDALETPIPADAKNFEAFVSGEPVCFRDISMAHAQQLTPEENLQYMAYLTEIANRQADSDPEVNERILSRAWYDLESANQVSMLCAAEEPDAKKRKTIFAASSKANKARFKTRLTREEALMLGHILDFTLTEMQWYLLRVFDVEDGLRFNQSNDLIEAYGFLTGSSWQHVQELKASYNTRCAGIAKRDDPERNRDWTRSVSDTLMGEIERWMRYPDTMDDSFLDWMQSKAPGLDIPSRTARRIYRNLAAFAWDLLNGEEVVPEEADFADCIEDVYRQKGESSVTRQLLYENGEISRNLCKKVADVLLLENKIQSASIQADNAKAWHILSVRNDGSLTPAGGIINSGRSRVADILYGTVQVEKGDMLYLLWFIANLIWQNTDTPDTKTLSYRIMDFMDIAQYLLHTAMLPDFYPPHIMEQSMLLSIVCGGKEAEDSSVVYEYMLHALTETRERKKGAKRHDESSKLEIVRYYRDHPEITLEECAKKFEVSPQSLSRWQKELMDEGKL